MEKEETIAVEGTVVEPLPNAMFKVELRMGIWFSPIFLGRCGCILLEYFLAIR